MLDFLRRFGVSLASVVFRMTSQDASAEVSIWARGRVYWLRHIVFLSNKNGASVWLVDEGKAAV